MVQQTFESIDGHLLGSHEVKQDARIEVAATCSHGNASCGSETHRGINRETIFYCREARAISQVRNHHTSRQILVQLTHNGFVRQTMKAIAPYSLEEKIAWQGKSRG